RCRLTGPRGGGQPHERTAPRSSATGRRCAGRRRGRLPLRRIVGGLATIGGMLGAGRTCPRGAAIERSGPRPDGRMCSSTTPIRPGRCWFVLRDLERAVHLALVGHAVVLPLALRELDGDGL